MKIIDILSSYRRKCKKYWKGKVRGDKFNDFERGPGYYITTGLLGHNPIGMLWEPEMSTGKVGIFELVSYKKYRDPWDMIECSQWNFLGYKGVKLIRECSFDEFLKFYPNLIGK